MKPSTRIIVNTLATYGRSLVAMGLSLFSARWVLQALGPVDFGLYGVIGSIILLITFLNDGMNVGVTRFYAYSIGRSHGRPPAEAREDLQRWFNAALAIHLVLPLVLVAAGYPLGMHAIHHWLTIPADRVEACEWVLRISLITALMNVVSVPFIAMYTAHQHIAELAAFSLIGSVGTFVGAYGLLGVESDRLVVYALYMMGIGAGLPALLMARAMIKFDACRVRPAYLLAWPRLKELFGFVGWKMFGMSCVVFRLQGSPVLINLYFGPQVNAAYSIAQRISTQAESLSASMTMAFQPAMTTLEGQGDRGRMLEAALGTCKYATFLVLLFVTPLILEMDTVLAMWLGQPPAYTAAYCNIMLVMLVLDKITSGPMMAVNARGRIAAYELVQGLILFSAIPLAWLFVHRGAGPVAVGHAFLVTMALYCAGRLLFCRRLLGLPLLRWAREVLAPAGLMIAASLAASLPVQEYLPAGLPRVLLIGVLNGLVLSFFGWRYLLSENERVVVRQLGATLRARIGGAPVQPSA